MIDIEAASRNARRSLENMPVILSKVDALTFAADQLEEFAKSVELASLLLGAIVDSGAAATGAGESAGCCTSPLCSSSSAARRAPSAGAGEECCSSSAAPPPALMTKCMSEPG